MDFFHPSDTGYGKPGEMRGDILIEILWPPLEKICWKRYFLKND
jgi:hypothetical protein